MNKIKNRFWHFGVQYKLWILLTVTVGIFLQVFAFWSPTAIITVSLTALWILSIWFYKFKGNVSVSVALSFLILCSLLLMFGLEEITEKVATWAFTFLWLGVGQMIIEYIREEKRDARGQK